MIPGFVYIVRTIGIYYAHIHYNLLYLATSEPIVNGGQFSAIISDPLQRHKTII